MNQTVILGKNSTQRRFYQRRNRKGNRTITTTLPPFSVPLTTTLATTNTTLILNSSSVPIQDLFAPISYFIQYKHFFLIGLCVLLFLCVLTIIFLILIRCIRGKSPGKTLVHDRKTKDSKDFLDPGSENHDANISLLDAPDGFITFHNTSGSNGILPNDNISTTYSLDPVLLQKINQNNPPNTNPTSAHADDMSLNTLRGSIMSTPSQQIPGMQPTTPISPPPSSSSGLVYDHRNSITTNDSITINHEDRVVEAEEDDDLQGLELKPITQHFIKTANRSTGNLANHKNSTSSSEMTIRSREKKEEAQERADLHGSNTNIYIKEMKRQVEQDNMARNHHTNSQISLVSRASEDSCY